MSFGNILRWIRSRGLVVSVLLISIFSFLVLLPVGNVLWGAFQTGDRFDPDSTFTLRWVAQLFTSPRYLDALRNTLAISAVVAGVTTVFGGLLAWIIARTDTPWVRILGTLVMMPLFISPFVGAIAWITLASPQSGFINLALEWLLGSSAFTLNIFSFAGILAVMTMYYVPYAYLFLRGPIAVMDPALEEAGQMAGAGTLGIVRTISLPLVRPALAASFLFVFIQSTAMFSVPALLGGPPRISTLAVQIYGAVNIWPPRPQVAAAVSLFLLAVTVVGIFFYRRLIASSSRYVTLTARGYRPRLFRLGRWKYLAFAVVVAYFLIAVVLPFAALLVGSFLKYFTPNVTLESFGLWNYQTVFSQSFIRLAASNTLMVSIIAPTICVVLGVIVSFVVLRTRVVGKGVIDYLGTLPLAVPGLVFGVGVLWTYIRTPLYGTLGILVLALVANYVPHVMRIVSNGLIQIDKALEESSTVSGASRPRTLLSITAPLLTPSIFSAWALVFIFTARELSASVILYSPRSVILPVLTFDYMQAGELPLAAALALLQSIALLVVLWLSRRFGEQSDNVA